MNAFISITLLLGLMMTTLTVQAQKKAIHLETTQRIKAEKAEVFDVIRSLSRFPEWSPFILEDPEQKITLGGQDGTIGSTYHWLGVAEKSEGTQTLAALEGEEYVRMECDITVPFKSAPTFEYQLSQEGDEVFVKQIFHLPCSGVSYFMMKLLGIQKKMEETNQLGMNRLKELIEKQTTLSK